ncbi:hypothetical protein [Roseateles sp. BYS87W]|uniref:Sugar transporter n=1 Tax=Pelomonas baiyunensis TaxID=3299026 RepID=A0ABW7GYP6_9BURK
MSPRPTWFTATAGLLLLWALAGVAACAGHVLAGEQMAAAQSEWDANFFRALPAWFAWDYAVATGASLAGAVALLRRSRLALGLYAVSLAAVIVQFGYVFAATDLIAHKGAAATVPFPVFIAVMGGVQIAVARMALRRGWIGAD